MAFGKKVIPVVPAKGSVGASGDLAPLAHLFLPLIGHGQVYVEDEIIEAEEVLKKFDKAPLQLHAKEALALINGTQFMLSYAVYILHRLENILDMADVISALSLDGLKRVHESIPIRNTRIYVPLRAVNIVAERMSTLLDGSNILSSHEDCERVQDPYSLRCIPAIHGASRNAFNHLKRSLRSN